MGGEGWKAIQAPASLWLFRSPANKGDLLSPATRGLSPEGTLLPVEVDHLEVMGETGWIEFNHRWLEEHPAVELRGAWLCVPREWLQRNPDELYVFQLIGSSVRTAPDGPDVAVVKDFFDTGAHGVLVLEMADGREIMIPFLDQFVEVRDRGGLLIIETFQEFII